MTDSWDDMRRAKEEQFFDEQNKAALNRLKARKEQAVRKCPICAGGMEQRALMGVIIDVCPETHGVWLDNGELEEIMKASGSGEQGSSGGWLSGFLKGLKK